MPSMRTPRETAALDRGSPIFLRILLIRSSVSKKPLFPVISKKPLLLGMSVNKGASGVVAEVGTYARYQEVAVLTDVLLALG